MLKASLICTMVAVAMAIPVEKPSGFAIRTEHRFAPKRQVHHIENGKEGQEEEKNIVKGIEDYDSFPIYKFEYGVKDMHTGDHKMQWEERHGDVVKGAYMLDEADGTQRIVEYKANDKEGFVAVVKKIGKANHHKI